MGAQFSYESNTCWAKHQHYIRELNKNAIYAICSAFVVLIMCQPGCQSCHAKFCWYLAPLTLLVIFYLLFYLVEQAAPFIMSAL